MDPFVNRATTPTNVDQFAELLRSLRVARQKCKESYRNSKRRRRSLSALQSAQIFQKTAGRCHICGGTVEGAWQADHVLAHSGGGTHVTDNYLAAHALCNNYRWDYSSAEFQQILKLGVWLRTNIERKTQIGTLAAKLYLIHEALREKRSRKPK
jgi:predicted nucleic acid-binding protein